MMSAFLVYSKAGKVTGVRLAQYLGIPSGKATPCERFDYLIRWGSARRLRCAPSIRTINMRRALLQSTQKLRSFCLLKDANIPVPPFSKDWSTLEFPMVGRKDSHRGGTDIVLCLQPLDARRSNSDFFVHLLPKKVEYRVHVFGEEILKVSQKKLRWEGHYDPVCWNLKSGWAFCRPRTDRSFFKLALPAVKALGLDFGAVDIVVGVDDLPYVLEVNAAPGLSRRTSLAVYAEKLRQVLSLGEVPGRRAVEWEVRDE